MLKILLSSTFKDLISERQAVENAIHRMAANYVGMEHFGSFAEEPLEKCLGKVRSANVIILVLGDKYGFIPEGSSISITEAEYREAVKTGLPILSYLKEDRFHKSKDDHPQLTTLKEELKLKHGISSFSSPDDLAWKVISDLAREFLNDPAQKTAADNVKDHILFSPIQDRIEELISILENRAETIQEQLEPHFKYAPVKKYLKKFTELHKKHIASLKAGKVIEAHELLVKIHELSAELQSDEFWTNHRINSPGVLYSLRGDAFKRGVIICGYVAGEMKSYSDKYPDRQGFLTWSFYENPHSPLISLGLYERILSDSDITHNKTNSHEVPE